MVRKVILLEIAPSRKMRLPSAGIVMLFGTATTTVVVAVVVAVEMEAEAMAVAVAEEEVVVAVEIHKTLMLWSTTVRPVRILASSLIVMVFLRSIARFAGSTPHTLLDSTTPTFRIPLPSCYLQTTPTLLLVKL